ncbi:MAG: hypothetical protein RSC06_12000 [Clostridia bacterium]
MEPNAKIIAARKGLKACTDAVEKLRKTAHSRADRALERYGPESEQYALAVAEANEIESTAYGWLYMAKGRMRDLDLAAGDRK